MSDSGNININDNAHIIGNVVKDNVGTVTANINLLPRPRVTLPPIDPVAAQALFDTLPIDAIPNLSTFPQWSRMPLLRNPEFVGRDAELLQLAAAIKGHRTAAITTGIGGVGKTQLASEFVHRYGQFFAGGVFWISFADPTTIDSEIAACGGAGVLELYTDADELTQAEQVQRVRGAWAQEIPRLLIIDNCDDQGNVTAEALLAARLPRSGGCRVLVTSRRGQWSKGLGLFTLPLDVLKRPASITLLRSYRANLSDKEAKKIADVLGDLPLALTLAGSYLSLYDGNSFGEPVEYLKNLERKLLNHRSLQGIGAAPSLTEHDLNVRATFALSYEQLDATDTVDALARAALACAACLAPGEPFPRDLLLATFGEQTDDEDVGTQRADALLRLVALGLVENTASDTLQMHRLIAAFVHEVTADMAAQLMVEWVLINVAQQINDAGYPNLMHPFAVHLRHCVDTAFTREDAQAAVACAVLNIYLSRVGDYQDARPYSERALTITEQVLGAIHPQTATSLNNLAYLLERQGDYAGAQPLYERALAIREQVLGATHPHTATSLNNLAHLLESQGDYADAQPLYERALAIREQVQGVTHSQTAISLDNLAGLLKSQGDYAGAQSLYERALAIAEQVQGVTHPQTATSLNNLANLLQSQGDYAGAQSLYERALVIAEQVQGVTHPQTATILDNLAYVLQSQGNYDEAQPLYVCALAIRAQVLGANHPETATSLNNLAGLFESQGNYDEAQPLYVRALAIREQVLGANHPETAGSLNNLACLLESQGDYAGAQPLFEQALAIREQVLGANHPDTAGSLNNLAGLLQSQGDYQGAKPLYERALAIREQVLGANHPDTAGSLNNLAGLLQSQGEYTSAQPLFERALAVAEQMLGPTHPQTATSLNNLAYLLARQGDYAGAHPLYTRALWICEQRLEHDHPTTRTIRANFNALNVSPSTAAQQSAYLTAQVEAAVIAACADPHSDRTALAEHLETIAQQAEAGEDEGSPYLALAAHLRMLAARLTTA